MKKSTPSRAEQFFLSLGKTSAIAYSRILALVETGEADENEWRDFKEAKFINGSLPPESGEKRQEEERRKHKIKEIWSENLSAFANTDGGVLIWGIKAPRRVAESLSLAGDARALQDRLIELQNEAVDPPVLGVEVRAVTQKGKKEGFVVCYIPGSAYPPHRAKWAKREYYMRVGDSNLPIPTSLLRLMFYPRSIPLLVPVVSAKLVKAPNDPNTTGSTLHRRDGLFHIEIRIVIVNRGNASAQDPFVMIKPDLHCRGNHFELNPMWLETQGPRAEFSCKTVIHPDQTIPLVDHWTNGSGFASPDNDKRFSLSFRLFARDAPSSIMEVSFTGKELKASSTGDSPLCRDAVPVDLVTEA